MKGRSALYPEQRLRRRVMSWAVELKVNPTQVVVQSLTDKWGTCTPDGVVTLAADLADADDEIQDYVIVHELLHLRNRGHGKVFKALLAAHVPQWREAEARLGQPGPRRPLEAGDDHDGSECSAV